MLRIVDGEAGVGRREFLTVGGAGLAGLALSTQARLLASPPAARDAITGKSVIFLFQQGGPSQFETFDPKMEAPSGIRTVGGDRPTALPGVRFGAKMERLAALADKLTIVRSFQTLNAGHNLEPLVGRFSKKANIGVHYSRVAGATRSATGTPTNAVLFPAVVEPDVPGPEARGDIDATGPYGSGFAPFVPGTGGQLQEDMELRLPPERIDDRRQLLDELDSLHRRLEGSGRLEGLDEIRAQAFELLLGGGVRRALDLSLEDPETVARYDTSHFARPHRWDKVNRGKRRYYNSQAKTIGRLLLIARRLCEAGCGFVTIHAGYAGVWDMHADGNNLDMVDGMEAIGGAFDHAVAAFVEDLEARGLSDRILLAATGEMGRTPKLNKRGGRDHWAKLAPLLLYGGGTAGGRVIGRSDRLGGEPATTPYTPEHLISTMLGTLFDIGELRLRAGVPREVLELGQHPGIADLV